MRNTEPNSLKFLYRFFKNIFRLCFFLVGFLVMAKISSVIMPRHLGACSPSAEGGGASYFGFISPLSHGHLTVISRLSHSYLTVISRLSHGYLTAISALSRGYHSCYHSAILRLSIRHQKRPQKPRRQTFWIAFGRVAGRRALFSGVVALRPPVRMMPRHSMSPL